MPISTKSQLSRPRADFIELMQCIGFGKIEHLTIRNCEPVLDPPPRIIRDVKFGAEDRFRPESFASDFAVKAQVVELFDSFDSLGNGTIRSLDVKHGLPFRMQLEEVTA